MAQQNSPKMNIEKLFSFMILKPIRMKGTEIVSCIQLFVFLLEINLITKFTTTDQQKLKLKEGMILLVNVRIVLKKFLAISLQNGKVILKH